eukprot:GHRR01002269.1.p1 GENE.GHRR01002269.1~~GHRR01002269.1.p1  ORF type:complete len:394 (+),score=108.57 GHRR01002269.1:225-1406(+)
MRLVSNSISCQQAIRAHHDLPLILARLQLMLTSSTAHSSGGSLSRAAQARFLSAAAAEQPHSDQQASTSGRGSQQADASWRAAGRYAFSVRPSVLSPLHAIHKEQEEAQLRLHFLRQVISAHMKLSEQLHPDELKACEDAADPVAAALATRKERLKAAKDSFLALRNQSIVPCNDPQAMKSYYTVLETVLLRKDPDARVFRKVLEGDRSVWDYWFKHFVPQYAALPGLGSIEKIYNQPSEEVLLKHMAQSSAAVAKPAPQPIVDKLGRARARGARKTSTAQVLLGPGQGRNSVNGKPLDAYFGDLLMRSHALKPLMLTGLVDKVDVMVQVHGGGVSGQAQATSHGIAKALRRLDPCLKLVLKPAGLLKRDPRMVERKKPGKAKARKSFPYVKR